MDAKLEPKLDIPRVCIPGELSGNLKELSFSERNRINREEADKRKNEICKPQRESMKN